jgi:hypothetical protein
MDIAGIALAIVGIVAVVGVLIRLVMWPYITAKRIRNAVSSKASPRDRADAREELGETGRRATSFFGFWFGLMAMALLITFLIPVIPGFLLWILVIAGAIAAFLLYNWSINRI